MTAQSTQSTRAKHAKRLNVLMPVRLDRDGDAISTVHRNLARELALQNVAVTAFAANPAALKRSLPGVTLRRCSTNRWLAALTTSWYCIRAASPRLIIHAPPIAAITPALRVAQQRGATVVVTMHESPTITKGSADVTTRWLLRSAARAAHGVAAISKYVAESTAREYQRDPAIIGHGISGPEGALFSPKARDRPGLATQYGIPEDTLLVLSVGALRPGKGMDTVAALARSVPDATVVIIGDGTQRASLERVAQRTPNLRVIGALPRAALPRWYASADCFLFASEIEGFGLAPLEAAACGTPVVALKAGALPELITLELGTVVPRARLPEALRAALNRATHETNTTRTERSRTVQKQYSWRAAAKAYASLYRAAQRVNTHAHK